MQDLQAWLAKIEAGNADFRRKIGPLKVGLFRLASYLLAGPRLVVLALTGRLQAVRPGAFQWPWVPRWPGLIEGTLLDLFFRNRWEVLHERPCHFVYDLGKPSLVGMVHTDGELFVRNTRRLV